MPKESGKSFTNAPIKCNVMQTPNSELQTLIDNNANDRMAIILAFQMGYITSNEMQIELRRLDGVLTRIFTEWSADHKLIVPVLDEDLVCKNILVLGKNQYN